MADKNKVKDKMSKRRRLRVRSKIKGTAVRPRLTVFKSLNNVTVQVIDDIGHCTLIGLSTKSTAMSSLIEAADSKTIRAGKVGQKVAEMAKEKGIEKVVFDRNRYRYHGRVKAVADGARKGGLQF